MVGLLPAAAALAVGWAVVVSVVLYLPLLAAAETLPARRADLRSWCWLGGLLLPAAAGVGGALWGLTRHLQHPLFSPHAGRLRPHLCLRGLVEAPDGPWRVQVAALLCLALVVAAALWLLGGLARLVWQQATARRQGRPLLAPAWARGVHLRESDRPGVASSRGLGSVVVLSAALPRLFTAPQREAILAHEVCHARRRDNLTGLLAAAALLLQALSPAAWACYRNWRLTREMACDLYAARLATPQAAQSALGVSRQAADLVGELRPLGRLRPEFLRDLRRRAEYLHEAGCAASEAPRGPESLALLVAALAVVALSLVAAATVRQVPDSLHCAAESLWRVLGR